ncbi:peptidyl-prolyl cis-trans isomerase FKBP43 isoform X4 [Manihot esculenta]|uniref:peptidyl-prolyl cis-trans isomerase FKBP43 isoform X4 n=1 Tax=Manihot esculenta TaxID=3983 RepID=UPI000B5D39F9|nr:peptidyl-prolyl cis-trans isomerase FKBP43 isoform X4 [Manihot esculenta]
MAFWGAEVKAGKPFTHKPDDARGRLHISQATLGIGTGTKKSVVQCNVGKRSPVFLCSLFPQQSESCQLNLEFEEADEVVFSVIGPISVHLTGYYVGGSRHYKQDESESYGEDIADTETERSTDGSGEDEYEDSFIDDGDQEVTPSSPVSNDGVAEEILHMRKPKNEKAKHRRLRKKYQLSPSDDEYTSQQYTFANGATYIPALDSETDDVLAISSIYKSTERNRSPEAKENAEKVRGQKINEMKDDDNCAPVEEQKANAVVVDSEFRRQPDQHESNLPSAHVSSANDVKPKKKRKKQSKEEKQLKTRNKDDFFFGAILKWDKDQQSETQADKLSQDMAVANEEDQRTSNEKGYVLPPPSVELAHGIASESKKKKKKQAKEEKGLQDGNPLHGNVNKDDKAKAENREKYILMKNEENQKKENDEKDILPGNSQFPSNQLGTENGLKPKRKRKDKTLEASGKQTNVIKGDLPIQEELKSNCIECNGSQQDEQNQRVFDNNVDQSANENDSRKRKKKRKNVILENRDALNMEEAKDRAIVDTNGNNGNEKPSQLRSYQID